MKAGPSRHVYDVAIVGGQLAGAIAAALLCKRGHKVLVVEHDGLAAGYTHEGYVLPFSPFVMPALKSTPSLEGALSEIGIATDVHRAMDMVGQGVALIRPGSRMVLKQGVARAEEFKRALGESGAALAAELDARTATQERFEALWRALAPFPATGFWDRLRVRRAAARFRDLNPLVAELPQSDAWTTLRGLLPLTNFMHAPHSWGALRTTALHLGTLHSFPGGREGLRDVIFKRVTDLGGDVISHRDDAMVEAIAFDERQSVGLQLVAGSATVKASALISATDAAALRRLIVEKKRVRKLSALLDGVTARDLLFSMNWIVPERALPRGLGPLSVVRPDEAPDRSMIVQVRPAIREDKARHAMMMITAATVIPQTARERGDGHLADIVAQMERWLDALCPFMKEHVVSRSTPYLHAQGARGSRLVPHPLLAFDEPSWLGLTGLPLRLPMPRVYLANREVLPGLGLEGEAMAGIRAAAEVTQFLHRKNPLERT